MLKSLLKHRELILDVVILIFISFFILSFFRPGLIFLNTTINGGDTGSHFPCAAYLKEVLLPGGKIMGWMQGNYAGYPLFYHYFPSPFLLATILSIIFSLEVSFKIATILGTLLFPLCIYFSFRFFKYQFPIPIFAAIFSLAFLFNQGNSMWGGNIPSTLAGEFCYSLGIAIVFLFLGSLYRGVNENKYLIFNVLLILFIGLSHAYTLIFCLLPGIFFAIDDFKKNFKYLSGVYGFGFLFLSFWLLPVLANLPYTTAFVFRWTINSISEVFPLILIPFILLSIITFYVDRNDRRNPYFLFILIFSILIYWIGPRIGVLDIRFVPFMQVILAIYGAAILINLKQKIKLYWILPIIAFLLVVIWVDINTTFIRSWIEWNYSGYEKKTTWDTFSSINNYLKHSGSGRVEWEHSPEDEALGSIRSSETLPYFAKRNTLEGIHMLGALTAPFVFYIESETSFQACNPIPDYFYSTLDLKRGIDHFRLFNVSHFVVRSSAVKEVIRDYPELKLEKVVKDYHIYRLVNNDDQYVTPLKNHPVLFLANNWRDISYQWFASEKLKDTFLVFMKQAGDREKKNFKQVITKLDDIKTIPYPLKNIQVKSVLKEEAIEIKTSAIGHPLLIKVSYHPNWKVVGADRIYFVSPSFMLIYPKQHKVVLKFEPGLPSKVGSILTLIGIIIAILFPHNSKLFFGNQKNKKGKEAKTIWQNNFRAAIGIVFVLLILDLVRPSVETLMKSARQDFDHGEYNRAKKKYIQIIKTSKLSSGARCEAEIFYATTYLREGEYKKAKNLFTEFIYHYPNSFWTPQAYFDLADCEMNLGNREGAFSIYKKIIRDFKTTAWAKYSKERLE